MVIHRVCFPTIKAVVSKTDQPGLFGTDRSTLPAGFKYQTDLITAAEEADLVRQIEKLPFKEFDFHGFLGKRRVVSFGWRYDFSQHGLEKADDIPPFLMPLRKRAADFTMRLNRISRAPSRSPRARATTRARGWLRSRSPRSWARSSAALNCATHSGARTGRWPARATPILLPA